MTTYAQEMARERYPEGSRIVMMESKDPEKPIERGARGRVVNINDAGTLKVSWDLGRISFVDPVRDQIDQED